MALITFNPAPGTGLISLDDIPQEVKDDVEAMYSATYFEAGEDGKLSPRDSARPGTFRAREETKQKVLLWFAQARDYGTQRLDGKLVVRRSPTSLKARDENEIDLSVRTEEDAKREAAQRESKENQK